MIKIIIPIDEDTFDSMASLLKLQLSKGERQAANSIIEKIKRDGVAEVAEKAIEDVGAEFQAGITMLAIASSVSDNQS